MARTGARFVLLMIFMQAIFTYSPAAFADSEWITNYSDAVAKAKKEGKVILLDFTGSDWCVWCKKLKLDVFDTAVFKSWADSHAILVEVDFPRGKKLAADLEKQNTKLAKDFAVKGFPSVVILNPDGKKLGELGYQPGGPAKWTAVCDRMIAKAAK